MWATTPSVHCNRADATTNLRDRLRITISDLTDIYVDFFDEVGVWNAKYIGKSS